MKIHLFSPVHFEKWDWRNSTERGIGGSETCHTEISWRFARRGYEVHSYAPIPDDCTGEWRGTKWHRLEDATFQEDGLWIFFRSVVEINKLEKKPGQTWWLNLQDEGCTGTITEETANKIDAVMAFCEWHKSHIERTWPMLKGKIFITSNGIKADLIREIEAEGIPERNQKKLIYASSPDRGLLTLLKIFRKSKEIVPDLELHCFYGVDNIEKLIEFNPRFSHYKGFVEKLRRELDQPGVHWRGRVSQRELYREWLTAGIWCYPTHFGETSCITSMEAQSLGAVPITNPYWALSENVKYGIWITGDPQHNSLIQARYVDAVVRVATSPPPFYHKQMIAECRSRWNWDRIVDQWEAGIDGKCASSQFAFQLRHAEAPALNVGCNEDVFDFKEKLNATNLDITNWDVANARPNKADIIADARSLPASLHGKFGSVILGDILEHMTDDDAVAALWNAKQCLANGGPIVVTVPHDTRPVADQKDGAKESDEYTDGVTAFHVHPVTRERLESWVAAAGLKIDRMQELDYTHFSGWGITCR